MRYKLILIMFLLSQLTFSQKKSLRIANEQYLKSNYQAVIKKYNKIKTTKYAFQFSDYMKLAYSYYNLGDYYNSKINYNKAFKISTTTSKNHKLNYMHLNLVFNDSVNYQKFSKVFNLSDTAIDKYINKNSLLSDEKIVIKVDSLLNKFNFSEDAHQTYISALENGFSTNLYKEHDSLNFKKLFNFNFEINQGSYSRYKKSDTFLITLNENNGKRMLYRKNKSTLKIYQINVNDSILAPRLISINKKNFNFSNPVYSNNYKKLYFVSDMLGGYGDTDIYMADIELDGSYTNITNLGPRINTSNRERFITLDAENNLYFSSNGHGGLGGLDIFKVNLNNVNATPENLGSEINSKYDEFYYYAKNDTMYYSSNSFGLEKTYVLKYKNTLEKKKPKPLLNEFKQHAIDSIIVLDNNKLFTSTIIEKTVFTPKPVVVKEKVYTKVYHLILGSFRTRKQAEDLKKTLLQKILGEVQILERTSFGFYRVSIKRYSSYRSGSKDLPFYINLGYLDAWVVSYIVENKVIKTSKRDTLNSQVTTNKLKPLLLKETYILPKDSIPLKAIVKTLNNDSIATDKALNKIMIRPNIKEVNFINKKIKIYHLILGSFLNLNKANEFRKKIQNQIKEDIKVLERTPLGFYRVSAKRYRSYKLAKKDLPFYINLGTLDAWIVPYLIEVNE